MKNYDKRVRQTRILLSDYLLLKGFAQKAGVSMSEALHDILTRRPLPKLAKQAPVTIEPSAQISAPVFFKPKAVSGAIVAFKPKAVTGNGVAHIKLKSIEEVG